MNPFEKLALELKRLQAGYREESYYRSLCEFLEAYGGGKEYLHMLNIAATSNPNSESIGEGIGFPDIEIRRNRRLVGYIEVKAPNENLDNPAYVSQFNKYKESLENVVYTNFKKWILYTWDKDGKPQKTEEAEWDYQQDLTAEKLKKLLTVFFEGQSYQAKTPHQLAIALARKTKLLSQQVEEALTSENPDKMLADLKKTFEKTLIQDIGDHQFANIYAETIAYSLFLAKLEHFEKGSSENFTLRTAVDFLPKNVPIFKDLYQLTGGRIEPITPGIYKATEILIEQLNFADIERIYKKLVEHKPGEDPVIQFYAPFLSEYDPEERKARGVYYTPKPVVDYIVRSVDHILKTKFNKPKGLGDESVQILDPATGTGTFLMSVIQNIYSDIEKENKPLGEELVKRKFNDVVSKHILKHLYGFELLVAPYAIAHLKLTLELERLGFDFSTTENDQDKENDRLKIFLANTLDDPEKPPINLFGFESITEESEQARLIKKDKPILIITGNPPYSVSSSNKSKWIEDLMQSYKKAVREEQNLQPLSDDYIKFIRFGQWKIEKTGYGVFAMITNHSYLGGLIHRGMREELMKTYDQIYILDLHGNTTIGEKNPNGGVDQNVFDIQQGVVISFFIKYEDCKDKGVSHSELWGSRQEKFDFLITNSFSSTKWAKLDPEVSQNYFFRPQNFSLEEEYGGLFEIRKAMPVNSGGIKTHRDHLVYDFDLEELQKRIELFYSAENNKQVIAQVFQVEENRDWKIDRAKIALSHDLKWKERFNVCQYHPFDQRYIYYSDCLIDFPRQKGQSQMLQKNLCFVLNRQIVGKSIRHFLCSATLVGYNIFETASANPVIFPLYTYSEQAQRQSNLFEQEECEPNLSPEFTKAFSEKLGFAFVPIGRGNLTKTCGPEDIFYYAYAIFQSPTYRIHYAEQLKIDFPRLPLTSNKELFKKLVQKGNELVNLHLLGENPFDKSKTIFDDTSNWGVSIGGEKPGDVDDWKVTEVRYDEKIKRVYVNTKQYFEGIEKEVWDFMIGGYQVLDKWLKDRKKAERTLSYDDQIHYMKIVVSLRETIRIMKEIDKAIPAWPIK